MSRAVALLVLLALTGCAPFPDLDNSITDQARRQEPPGLAPVDQVMAKAAYTGDRDGAAEIEALRGRARLLQARAGILRRTEVIDSQSQAAMKAGYARLNP